MEELKLYTSKEVAEMLGITARTVWDYIKAGKIKARKVGRAWKITADNIKDFMDEGQEKTLAVTEIREVQADKNETRVNLKDGIITIYYTNNKGLEQGRKQAKNWIKE